jgi:chromosome segregation ATPase
VVDAICKQFSIYVNNPCVILTQEYSKVLMKSNPSEKYKFFTDASGINTVHETLVSVKKEIDDKEELLDNIEKNIVFQKAKVSSLDAQLLTFRKIDNLRTQIQQITIKKIWFPYHSCRLSLHNAEKELLLLKDQETALQQSIQKRGSDMVQLHALSSREDVLASTQAELSSLREELVAENHCYYDLKKRCSTLFNEIQLVQEEKNDVTKASSHIHSVMKSNEMSQKESEETNQFMQEFKKVEDSLQSTREQLRLLREEEENDKTVFQNIQERYGEVVETLKRSENTLRIYREDLSQYNTCKRNRGDVYFPSKFNALVESIRAEQFTHKVKGPIGLFLKIDPRYSEYAKSIESVIGANNLKSFLTGCMEDQRKISVLLDKHHLGYVRIYDIDPKSEAHFIPSNPDIVTLADALVIDDIDVFNMLVDVYKIDKIALCPSEEAMYSTVVRTTNGRKHFVENINKVVFQDGTEFVIREGNTGSFSYRGRFQGLIASTETGSVSEELQLKVKTEEDTVKGIQEEERSMSQKISLMRQHLFQKSESIKNHVNKVNALEKRLYYLKEEIQDRQDAVNDPHLLFKEELEVLTKRQNELESLIGEKEMFLSSLQKEQVSSQEKKRIIQEKVYCCESLLEKEQEKQNDFMKILFDEKKKDKEADESLVRIHDEIESVHRRIEMESQRLDSIKLKAEREHRELLGVPSQDRVPTIHQHQSLNLEVPPPSDETFSYLIMKLDSLEKSLNEYLQSAPQALHIGSHVEELKEKMQNHQEESRCFELKLEKLKVVHRDLIIDYDKRRERWEGTLLRNKKQLDRRFRENLKEKERRDGSIDIDLKEEKMYFQVNLDSDENDEKAVVLKDGTAFHGKVNDEKAVTLKDGTTLHGKENAGEMLSGGQRCFINTCFLLGLFSISDTPFRILDELDVFMDQIMRRKYLEVLKEFTLDPRNEKRQMIIITPQCLIGVQTSEHVHIHRIVKT